MKKSTRIIIALICIGVVALTFFLIHDMEKKIEEGSLPNTSNSIANSVNDTNATAKPTASTNVTNSVNETENNTIVENTVETSNEVEDNNSQESSMEETLKKENNNEIAIQLVKEKWGESDTTVYYTNEGINDNGEYLVAVRSKESTFIMASFKVNVSNNDVKIDL